VVGRESSLLSAGSMARVDALEGRETLKEASRCDRASEVGGDQSPPLDGTLPSTAVS
jgi:hypothetical protein